MDRPPVFFRVSVGFLAGIRAIEKTFYIYAHTPDELITELREPLEREMGFHFDYQGEQIEWLKWAGLE